MSTPWRPGPRQALAACVLALGGCGSSDSATTPIRDDPTSRVASLEVTGGSDQRILSGRRAPEPFTVLAADVSGDPVEGAVVEFDVSGEGGGILSQPRAITNADGIAESYLLEARSGPVVVSVRAAAARLAFEIDVERAPGALRFAPPTLETGLPGLPHPDSIVRVQLLDTEGVPMEGVGVWFTGPAELSAFRDTTDADGWAETVIRRSELRAGPGRVFAFLLDFPELTTTTSRPVVAAAERVVLVSVDGLRADAIDRYGPPTLSRLASEGAFTSTGRTVLPSLTTPAHLSLLGGEGPDVHQIFSDELEFTPAMATMEPLFKEANGSGLGTAAFMAREGPLEDFEVVLACKLAFGLDSLTLVEPTAREITEAAAAALEDPEVRMTFVHIPTPDLAGHGFGFESPEYEEAVQRTDSAISVIVDRLGPEDLLIVTSDHGGGGAFGAHQHGSAADADVLIPVILRGPHVVPTDLGDASILDIAPTALWALGFRPPNQYDGEILLRGFR